MPGSWVFSCSNLTASSVAFCDFALSSKVKTVVILDGSFDSSSDALFGSAFRKIVFDTWLMTVLAWSKPICTLYDNSLAKSSMFG
jgi:hypothetical protein